MTSTSDIGRLVRDARRAAGFTQQSLADEVGTTRQWIIRLEQGQRTVTMGVVLDVLVVLGLEFSAEMHSDCVDLSEFRCLGCKPGSTGRRRGLGTG